MGDEIRQAKAVRRTKLGNFTRKKNHITQLLEGGAKGAKLKEVYGELSDTYKVLEKAQEDLMLVLNEEDLDAEDAFLDAPCTALSDIDLRISTAAETEEQQNLEKQSQNKAAEEEVMKKKRVDQALAVLKASISGFGKPSANLV